MPKVGERFDPSRLFTGIFIPEAVVDYPHLSAQAKLCYGVLCRYTEPNGICSPSQEQLGRELGVKRRQVRRYLSGLQAKGFIRKSQQGLGKSHTYEFLYPARFDDSPEAEDPPVVSSRRYKPRQEEPF